MPRFAAGAEEVKFFLGNPGEQAGGKAQGAAGKEGKKGKKTGKTGPEPLRDEYITVSVGQLHFGRDDYIFETNIFD